MGAEDLFRGLFASVQSGVNAPQSRLQVFCAGDTGAVIANEIDRASAGRVAIEGDGIGWAS